MVRKNQFSDIRDIRVNRIRHAQLKWHLVERSHRAAGFLSDYSNGAEDRRKNKEWDEFARNPARRLSGGFRILDTNGDQRPKRQQQHNEWPGDQHGFAHQAEGEEKERQNIVMPPAVNG